MKQTQKWFNSSNLKRNATHSHPVLEPTPINITYPNHTHCITRHSKDECQP
ncbi:hypothetical protein Hanom_Chr07g00680271 [Helianthus anomalus]